MDNVTGTKGDKVATATIMVGGPGSGKSFVRKRDYAHLDLLDSDSIKESHPDYDPKNPSALHAWSSQMLERAFFAKVGAGEDFVLDGTGTNVEKYVAWMRNLIVAGYDIELVYVRTSMAVALERNRNRERVVPEHVVKEKHAVVEDAFRILSGYATTVRVVDNG